MNSRLEHVIIMWYFQMGTFLLVIRMYQKIGVLDNIGLFITIGEGIKDKYGNNLKGKLVCKLPNVTNESVTCNTNGE